MDHVLVKSISPINRILVPGITVPRSLMSKTHRFPIRFDRWYETLSTALFLPPSGSYVEVNNEQVSVQMGWAFRSRFPRGAVASVVEMHDGPLSRGVHGFSGRVAEPAAVAAALTDYI